MECGSKFFTLHSSFFTLIVPHLRRAELRESLRLSARLAEAGRRVYARRSETLDPHPLLAQAEPHRADHPVVFPGNSRLGGLGRGGKRHRAPRPHPSFPPAQCRLPVLDDRLARRTRRRRGSTLSSRVIPPHLLRVRAKQHRAILFTSSSSMPPADTVANSLRVPIACRSLRRSSLPSTP